MQPIKAPAKSWAEQQPSFVPMKSWRLMTLEERLQFKADCNVRAFAKGLLLSKKGSSNGNRD